MAQELVSVVGQRDFWGPAAAKGRQAGKFFWALHKVCQKKSERQVCNLSGLDVNYKSDQFLA